MKANRLINEQSPYLKEHCYNPVDWYIWGEEAFEKARKEDKIIFLSIGYSTCHWCHILRKEAFENEKIAELMNQYFVNIKVDREERADVDRVYMTYLTATTGGGGWPLSIFLTPNLKPIFAGTYFPPDDDEISGRTSFTTLIKKIHQVWNSDKKNLFLQQANDVMQELNEMINNNFDEDEKNNDQQTSKEINSNNNNNNNDNDDNEKDSLINKRIIMKKIQTEGNNWLMKCFEEFEREFDPINGGFGKGPKFPQPVQFNFLFRMWKKFLISSTDSTSPFKKIDEMRSMKILNMATFTLKKIANSAICDHIGGGFHRYSVDESWSLPHFEKMLYDNAQLVISYLDAYQITKDEFYKIVAQNILNYIQRDMTHPEGGFYNAEDADSLPTGENEKKEGAFYVWTKSEISQILGSEDNATEIFCYLFNVNENGNVDPEKDRDQELKGKNVLNFVNTIESAVKKFGLKEGEEGEKMIQKLIQDSKIKLFNERNKNRIRPHLDDKIICSCNALMISAFSKAFMVLKDSTYLNSAIRAAQFIYDKLYEKEKKTLKRFCRTTVSNVDGFLSDYSFLIQAYIDLYEASGKTKWLRLANELQERQIQLFNEKNGGFFDDSELDKSIILRIKEYNDGAEPSGNSVSALNLIRLGDYLDNPEFRLKACSTIYSFRKYLSTIPMALPLMLSAVEEYISLRKQFIIATNSNKINYNEMFSIINKNYEPNKAIIHFDLDEDDDDSQNFLKEKIPMLGSIQVKGNRATVYLCENYCCQLPSNDEKELEKMLEEN